MCLAIPGQIVEITDAERKLAVVDVSGVRRPINVACIIDAEHPIERCVGDWVLVHVGFAMSRIDEAQAAATLALLRELGEAQSQLEEMRASAGAPDSADSSDSSGAGGAGGAGGAAESVREPDGARAARGSA